MQISIEPTKANCQYTLVSLMNTVLVSGDKLARGPWCGVGSRTTEWQFGLDWDAWPGQMVLLDAHCRPRRPVCHGHLRSTGHRHRRPTRQRHGRVVLLRWGPGAGHLDVNLTYRCSALRLSSESISMCFVHAAASHSGASPSSFSVQVSEPARHELPYSRVRSHVCCSSAAASVCIEQGKLLVVTPLPLHLFGWQLGMQEGK